MLLSLLLLFLLCVDIILISCVLLTGNIIPIIHKILQYRSNSKAHYISRAHLRAEYGLGIFFSVYNCLQQNYCVYHKPRISPLYLQLQSEIFNPLTSKDITVMWLKDNDKKKKNSLNINVA